MAKVKTFNGTGADCSGSNGTSNRVLTLSNTGLTQQSGFLVYASGLALALATEYTVSHLSASTEITFLNPLWDDMTVVVQYYESIIGVGSDFELGPLADLGKTMTRTPVTVTTNFSGQKTYTDGTDEEITAIFVNPTQNFALDKSGLTEVFDAKILTLATQTINKYDKITYNSKVYRVDKVNLRKWQAINMFKSVILFFAE